MVGIFSTSLAAAGFLAEATAGMPSSTAACSSAVRRDTSARCFRACASPAAGASAIAHALALQPPPQSRSAGGRAKPRTDGQGGAWNAIAVGASAAALSAAHRSRPAI
jgi:hypothetical protein